MKNLILMLCLGALLCSRSAAPHRSPTTPARRMFLQAPAAEQSYADHLLTRNGAFVSVRLGSAEIHHYFCTTCKSYHVQGKPGWTLVEEDAEETPQES